METTNATLNSFRQLIALTVCGASKTENKMEMDDSDWRQILKLAAMHDVLPLVGCALLEHPEIYCPKQYKEYLLELVRNKAGCNLVKQLRFCQLINEMKQAGIDVCVIKGCVLAECYLYPESRNSSDNDILIPINQERAAADFLAQKGFRVETRSQTRHHAVCQHPKFGLLEVHVHLYDELVMESWFNGINENELLLEPTMTAEKPNESITTLGCTDHITFIALHMIKHFVRSGLGIKMLLDIMLFVKKHKMNIDFCRFWRIIELANYKKLMNAIIGIMVQTNYFSYADFPGSEKVENSLVEALLIDIVCGGYLGCSEMKERTECCDEYNRIILMKRKGALRYYTYMCSLKFRGAVSQMFPPVAELKRIYPKAEQCCFYIPLAYLRQMIEYPLAKLRKQEIRRQLIAQCIVQSRIAANRLELFKKLSMI